MAKAIQTKAKTYFGVLDWFWMISEKKTILRPLPPSLRDELYFSMSTITWLTSFSKLTCPRSQAVLLLTLFHNLLSSIFFFLFYSCQSNLVSSPEVLVLRVFPPKFPQRFPWPIKKTSPVCSIQDSLSVELISMSPYINIPVLYFTVNQFTQI